ncbi:MAG: HAD-IC family P-type ATPase, partial [Firmicutes bacterium]|nr:HAD-IC family P-type ATPase [Bacillota bacterium]
GLILIADEIKADAKSAVKKMTSLGLSTVMLTGDREETAKAVAKETGIGDYRASLLPQEKLSAMEALRKEYGAVMFVGDGINDAPVLAGADVGAAMGSGADAAIEAADVVFMTSEMQAIPKALRIARKVGRIAIQNVVFALGVKFAVMILGLLGIASMWLAIFADTGVAVICIINSIRILYGKAVDKG